MSSGVCVCLCVCSGGQWGDHPCDHPVSAAPRPPGQRPLLPAQERKTPVWTFREAGHVSDNLLRPRLSSWILDRLNIRLSQQHQREKRQRRDCRGDEDRGQDRRKCPPEVHQRRQEGLQPTDDCGQCDAVSPSGT